MITQLSNKQLWQRGESPSIGRVSCGLNPQNKQSTMKTLHAVDPHAVAGRAGVRNTGVRATRSLDDAYRGYIDA